MPAHTYPARDCGLGIVMGTCLSCTILLRGDSSADASGTIVVIGSSLLNAMR